MLLTINSSPCDWFYFSPFHLAPYDIDLENYSEEYPDLSKHLRFNIWVFHLLYIFAIDQGSEYASAMQWKMNLLKLLFI